VTNRLLFEHTGQVTVEAEAAPVEGQAPALPKLKIRAYNGGPMRVSGWRYPVVIDLSTLKANATIPILRSHSTDRIVGHGTPIITASAIDLEAIVSSDSTDATEIVRLGKNGFPWQASVGVDVAQSPTFIGEKDSVNVNGQTFAGPLNVVRGGELFETSVLPLGADKTTTAAVAASKGETMTTENSNQQLTSSTAQTPQADPVEAVFAAARRSEEYRGRIAVISQQAINDGADVQTVEAAARAAIAANLNPDAYELQLMRATRGASVHVRPGRQQEIGGEVFQCAMIRQMTGHQISAEREFSAQTLEATDRHFKHGISLTELLRVFARRNGWSGESNRDVSGLLKAAFAPIQASGVSGYDLSGILSNVANKMIRDGFNAVEQAWRQVTEIVTVNDFKAMTQYTLTGDLEYAELGKGQKIQHGTLGEETYTNQAKSYAKFIGIDRRDIINDDLGAFNRLRTRMGRGGALKLNEVFWTAFMDNASFFTSGRNNFDDGADTALSVDSLALADTLLRTQTDPDGKLMGNIPAILLTPAALMVKGQGLCRDTEIRNTTANTVYTTANPFAGILQPVSSAYLQDTGISGYSSKAWYLLCNPLDVPMIQTAFLFGVQTPTIEAVELPSDMLGIGMRGIFDFGVAKQEYRGAAKMKGEA
jgi:phage major head subunit gpT-like protein